VVAAWEMVIHGEGVDDGNVGDGYALWQGHEDVSPLSRYGAKRGNRGYWGLTGWVRLARQSVLAVVVAAAGEAEYAAGGAVDGSKGAKSE
jgi:hypothetical protein